MDQSPSDALIVAPYPRSDPSWRDIHAETETEIVIDVIRAIRDVRSLHKIPPGELFPQVRLAPNPGTLVALEKFFKGTPGYGQTQDAHVLEMWRQKPDVIFDVLNRGRRSVEKLARVQNAEVERGFLGDALQASGGLAAEIRFVATGVDGRLTLPGAYDLGQERARLGKEIEEAEAYLRRLDAKLGNEQFRTRAPREVVAQEEERRATTQTRLEGLRRALGELG